MSIKCKGMKYKCNQCDKEFTNSGTRYTHIKSIHEKKKYLCTLCDYQATTQGSLTEHKKSVQTVFRQGRTLLDQGCPKFDENFFGASVHEKIEILPFRTCFSH